MGKAQREVPGRHRQAGAHSVEDEAEVRVEQDAGHQGVTRQKQAGRQRTVQGLPASAARPQRFDFAFVELFKNLREFFTRFGSFYAKFNERFVLRCEKNMRMFTSTMFVFNQK